MTYRNSEGYRDPTAGGGIKAADEQAKRRKARNDAVDFVINYVLKYSGYTLGGSLYLVDREGHTHKVRPYE